MKCVGVKYCGGCNPHIERSKFVDELKKILAEEMHLTVCRGQEKWELGILVCGCATACADRPEIRELAPEWILVAGPNVDIEPTPVAEMARVVALKIRKYFGGRDPHEVA
jgi:hypothetical protein